jgi:hypothetical protein
MAQSFYGKLEDDQKTLTTFSIGKSGKMYLDEEVNLSSKNFTVAKSNVVIDGWALSKITLNEEDDFVVLPKVSQKPPCRQLVLQKLDDEVVYMSIEIS